MSTLGVGRACHKGPTGFVGPQERLAAVGMDPAADVDALRAEIESALAGVADGVDGGLILADMLGGSPANASGVAALAGTPVVCGVNLPMLRRLAEANRE